MPIPQAPRWEDPDEVKDILKRYRNAQVDKDKHTDFELAQKLSRQSKYKGINKSKYVSDVSYQEHVAKKNPRLYNLMYEKNENTTPRYDEEAPIGGPKKETGFGTFMGGFGLVDLAPDWLSNAIKSGANESITGLAVAIGSGDTPFDIDDDYDPNMVESAMSFGFGMVYDSWFFALTKGLGVGPALAGSTAKKAAAQGIAKQFFAREMTGEIGREAIKGMGKKASKKFIKKAIVKEKTADGAKKALLKEAKEKGVGIDNNILDTVFEKSVKEANNTVASMIAKPEFLSKGLTEIGKYKLGSTSIDAPSLSRMFGHFGGKAATGLGLYEASAETGRQMRDHVAKRINKETGEPFGYGQADDIIDLWNKGELGESFAGMSLELDKIAWRFAHGFSGGYMAGGLGGIMRAGRMGAFSGKKVNDALVNKLGDWTYGKAADMSLEATGFTGVGSLLNYMETGSVDMGEGHGLAGNFVHNLVTIGVLKGMRKIQDSAIEKGDQQLVLLERKMNEAHKKRKEAYDKVEQSQAGETSEASKTIRKEAKQNRDKLEDKYQEDIKGLRDRLGAIKKLLLGTGLDAKDLVEGKVKFKRGYKIVDGERVPNMTRAEAQTLIDLVRDFQAFKDKSVKEYGVTSKVLDKKAKESELFDFFEQDVAGGTGKVFAELERQLTNADNIRSKKEQELVLEKNVEVDKAPEVVEPSKKSKKQLDLDNNPDYIRANSAEGQKLVGKEGTLLVKENGVEYIKRPEESLPNTGNTIERASKEVESQTINKTTQNIIKKSNVGDKKVDSENNTILNYIARRKGVTEKSKAGGDVREASMFAKWLFKNTGKSIKDATKQDLQNYIDTGNKGNPFGQTLKQNSQKISNIMRWVKELKGLKGQGLSKVEALSKSKMGRPSAKDIVKKEAEGKGVKGAVPPKESVGQIKKVNTSLKKKTLTIGTGKNTKEVNSPVGHFANFVLSIMGKRGVALRKNLTTDDIAISSKTNEMIITVSDKGNQSFVLRVPNEKIMGVNYYEIFNKNFIGKEKSPLLKDSSGKALTEIDIKNLSKAISGKSSVHFLRKNIYEIAAELDAMGTKNSTGNHSEGFWSKFAEKSLVGHGQAKGGTAEQFYGKGYSKSNELSDIAKFWSAAEKIANKKKQIIKESYPGEADNPNRKKVEYTIDTKTGEVLSEQILALEGSGKGGERTILDAYSQVKAEQRSKVSKEVNNLRDLQQIELKYMSTSREGLPRYEAAQTRLKVLQKLERQALKKSKTVVEHPLHEKALKRVITLLAKRNKGLKVVIEKDGKNAGEIVGDLIKVTQGKADATTFFHENVHRLEAFVKATGDKGLIKAWELGEKQVISYAKKNHKKLYELYEKGYKPNELANELMTQLSAESALRQFNRSSTWLGRSKNWVNNLVSKLRIKLGLGSPKDISRLYGSIAERGFSTEGYRLKINQAKYQKIDSSGPPSSEARIEYLKVHGEKQLNRGLVRILMESTPGLEKLVGNINNKGIVEGLNAREQQLLTDSIARLDDSTFQLKRNKEHQNLLNATAILRMNYGITKKLSYEIGKTLGVPGGGSLRFASVTQLKRMQEMYQQFGKKYEPASAVLEDSMMNLVAEKSAEFGEIRKAVTTMTMPVGYVLRKMGMKKVAEKIEDHYYEEQRLVGIGHQSVHEVRALIGVKGFKHLAYAVDKTLLEPTVVDGKTIVPKQSAKRDIFIENSKKPGTKEYEAVRIVRKMYDRYWKEFMAIGKEKLPNPAEYEIFKEKYKPKYVEDYFTRVLTKEAQKHLNLGNNYNTQIASFVKQNQKIMLEDINLKYETIREQVESLGLNTQRRIDGEKQLKKLEATRKSLVKDITNPESQTYKKLEVEAERQLSSLIARSSTKVKNNNLMSRQPKLDNFFVNEQGKQIQTYETNFEKVFNKYQRNMSNFLSTVKHFNEYTPINGKNEATFSAQGEILKKMGKDSDLGAYLETVIKRRIGIESTTQANSQVTSLLNSAGKYSALFGLSSPFSGLKNLTIGTQMTLGVHGVRAFAYGLKKAFGTENWKIAREKGWLQIGTKEIEIGGLGNRIAEFTGNMGKTEAVNRVIGGFAGEFHARQMVQRLHKDSGLYASKGDVKIAKEMGDMFNLKPSEVAFLKRYGLDADSTVWSEYGIKGKRKELYLKEQRDILSKIQHYGHIKSQGAAGDPFLPLWAGNANVKALTLFYRMAYSGTANVWNHIITPAKNGNFLPLARYSVASSLAGGALWELYEKVLGQKPPKANNELLSRLGQNLAKSEALGLASFILNPYSNGFKLSEALSADSIMQPAIIRNTYNVAEYAMRVMNPEQANLVGATRDIISNTIVAAGHTYKYLSKVDTPFKTDLKNLRTFRSSFEKKSGLWDEYNKGNPFSSKFNQNAEYYNLIKNAFSGTDADMKSASKYYVATWYYLYDSYRVMNGYEQYNHKAAVKKADSALNNVVKKINPLYGYPDPKTGKMFDVRKKFLQYLKPEEKAKALKLEKQYYVKLRKLNSLIRNDFAKQGGYAKRGEIMKMFPIPPDAKLPVVNISIGKDSYKAGDVKKILPNI